MTIRNHLHSHPDLVTGFLFCVPETLLKLWNDSARVKAISPTIRGMICKVLLSKLTVNHVRNDLAYQFARYSRVIRLRNVLHSDAYSNIILTMHAEQCHERLVEHFARCKEWADYTELYTAYCHRVYNRIHPEWIPK